jgi:hypothetical protein
MIFNPKLKWALAAVGIILIIFLVLLTFTYIHSRNRFAPPFIPKGIDGSFPSELNPLVLLEPSNIKGGQQANVRIGFYNAKDSDKTVNISLDSCVFENLSIAKICKNDDLFNLISLPKLVSTGDSFDFVVLMEPNCKNENSAKIDLPEGKYMCKIKAFEVSDESSSSDIIGILAETDISFTVVD